MSSSSQQYSASEKSLDGYEVSYVDTAEKDRNVCGNASVKDEIRSCHTEKEDESDDRQPHPQGDTTSPLKRTASNVLTKVTSHLSTFSIVDPGPAPDGGLKAWTQCAMAWLVVFNCWGYANSFGAFQTYYESSLGMSASTISWIGSVQVWVLFFVGIFSGRALDAGFFLPTFVAGVVIQLIGIFTMSFSTKYWQIFLTQAVCTGIGGGIFFCPAMALLATYFDKNRGFAVALTSTGNSAGGMIYPTIVRQLLPKIGYGWTVRTLGFLNLACLSLVLAFMKPRLPPRKSGPIIEWQVFKEPCYALFVGGIFFMTWALYFTVYFITSFGRDAIGLSYTNSVQLLIIVNGIGIPARMFSGYVADRFLGVFNTFIPAVIINTILLYCWLAVNSIGTLYVFTCLYGLANAAFQSLFPTTVAVLTDDSSKMGTRLGMAFSLMGLAALTGPPLGGALLSTDGGGYMPAQVWVGTSTLIGNLLIIAARIYRYGWTVKVKC